MAKFRQKLLDTFNYLTGRSEKSLSPFIRGLIVAALGASGAGYTGLSYQVSAEFTARAQDAMSQRGLNAITISDFEAGAAGCTPAEQGAAVVAQGKDNSLVYLTACVSRTTEVRLLQTTQTRL